MSITFTLKRNVPVRRYDVVATIAREEKRAEIAPVLLWASSRAASGHTLDPTLLAAELLGPGAGMITVAKRLLTICRDLRLVDQEFTRLTDDGDRAVTSGKVLQPEKGEWTIWACEDPLLEFPIVGVAPKAVDANGNEREARRRDGPRSRPVPMPGWVLLAQNRVSTMLVDGRLTRFDDISAAAVETPTSDELQLFWTPGGTPEVHVVGAIGSRFRVDQPIVVTDLPPVDDVWAELLGTRRLARSWDSSRMALRIPFTAATTDDERLNMRTELTFKLPTVAQRGTFRDVAVSNIKLSPDSDRSASEWAKYQMVAQLGGVQTAKVYSALSDRVRGVFADWKVELPSRDALAQELAKDGDGGPRSRAFWALQAALDWNL